jgi:hypothetical protein
LSTSLTGRGLRRRLEYLRQRYGVSEGRLWERFDELFAVWLMFRLADEFEAYLRSGAGRSLEKEAFGELLGTGRWLPVEAAPLFWLRLVGDPEGGPSSEPRGSPPSTCGLRGWRSPTAPRSRPWRGRQWSYSTPSPAPASSTKSCSHRLRRSREAQKPEAAKPAEAKREAVKPEVAKTEVKPAERPAVEVQRLEERGLRREVEKPTAKPEAVKPAEAKPTEVKRAEAVKPEAKPEAEVVRGLRRLGEKPKAPIADVIPERAEAVDYLLERFGVVLDVEAAFKAKSLVTAKVKARLEKVAVKEPEFAHILAEVAEHVLSSFGRLMASPDAARHVYTRLCSTSSRATRPETGSCSSRVSSAPSEKPSERRRRRASQTQSTASSSSSLKSSTSWPGPGSGIGETR